MVTNKQTNEQPGDPSASLPLTSVRRQSFAIKVLLEIVFRSAKPTATMSSMPEPEETTFWDYPVCNIDNISYIISYIAYILYMICNIL